ncbi:MAG TPA: hypothetical protein VFX28_16305, partial [Methylomirabilota bacterium]|nr:hypothetical protein [Methylomirabilota bacterium]
MISLERLLDGLTVDVQPLGVREAGRTATIQDTADGSAVLTLTGGVTLRVSKEEATVQPAPRPRASRDDLPPGVRVSYRGQVGLFD